MEGYVATKLDEFDRGKISRRQLLETLMLAATSVYATGGAEAQGSSPPLKVALVKTTVGPFSYSCSRNAGPTSMGALASSTRCVRPALTSIQ